MKLTKQINLVNRGVLKSLILKNGPGWQTTESKGYLLIESGPDRVLENKVVTIINAAQEMICLQSFLIQDSDIINALVTAVEQRKVRVFVLSASNVRLKDNMEEEPDFKRADYVQMLEKKFRYNFVHRSSENFHAKFIVADAQTKPLGLICTNNFTTMGFAKNVEAGVLLSPEQCLELY
ncbi:MAG TPA: phospholipase D-like domain-containing protein, partial [Chitinophagales bacterium]|nr:phospholipase D-like domain-containing protein [Chitinophagales bacterium]